MRKSASHSLDSPTITVGQLISELCRWPDHAVVTFRCPHHKQELSFDHIESRSKSSVEIELDPAPESAPVVHA